MSIKVRYFASLKESLGRSEDTLQYIPDSSVRAIWQQANHDRPIPDHTLAAVNMEYVHYNHTVSDGDEIAFFPPVTGG